MKKFKLLFILAVMMISANIYGQCNSNTAYTLLLNDTSKMVSVSDTVVWFKFVAADNAIKVNLTYPQGVTPPATNISLYKMQSNSLVLIQQNNASASISYNNTTTDTSYIKITFATHFTGLMYFNVTKFIHYLGIGVRQHPLSASYSPFNQAINMTPPPQEYNIINLCYNQQPIDLQCIDNADLYNAYYTYRFKIDGFFVSNTFSPIVIDLITTYPYITMPTPLTIGVHTVELEIYDPNGDIKSKIGTPSYSLSPIFTITILDNGIPNSDILTIPTTICVGSTIILPVPSNTGVSYTLSAGGVNINPYLNNWWIHCYCPGLTTITVTATSICGGASTTTYPITVSTEPGIQSLDITCPDSPVQFNGLTCLDNAIDPSSYLSHCTWLWNFGDGTTSTYRNEIHSYATAGTYTVSFTIKYFLGTNCTSTETVTKTITVALPTIPIITGDHNNCKSTSTYIATNGTSYNWSINPPTSGTIISGQNTSEVTITWNSIGAHNFSVLTVTNNENGCDTSSSINVYQCCGEVILHDEDIENPSQIQPNTFINGTVTIKCNVNLNNQTLKFGPNAKIILYPGKTFTIDNNSSLQAGCEYMWDGIYVSDPLSGIEVTGHSTIQDAINGIVSENGGKFTLNDANMNANLYSVRVHNYTDPTSHTGSIRNTRFNEATTFSSGPTNLIYPPCVGQKTFCGVESSWILGVLNIGDETDAANLNTFQNMRYGVYAANSNINVVNNKFLNIQAVSITVPFPYPMPSSPVKYIEGAVFATNSFPWFTMNFPSPIGSWSFTPAFDVEVGGNGLKRNYFDNCKTGIYTYRNLSTIENNNFKNCGYGIRSIDVADKSKYTNNTIYGVPGNVVTPGYGIDLRNVFSNPKGIGCLVDSNDITNKYYGISLINISGNKTYRFADVNSNKIWFNVTAPTPASITHTGIWAQNSNFSQIKYNRIIRNVHAFAGLEDNNVLGIRIADCIEAKVMQNQINRMGSGIFGDGTLTNTKFGCNSFYDNYFGLNFNWSASVSAQGEAGVYNPDNGWYDGTQNGFLRIKKVFGPLDYYYDPTVMNAYDPSPYPFWGGIIVHQNTGVATLCVANPGSIGTGGNTGYGEPNFDVTARETAFGSIVRGEKLYSILEEEYRQKDREYVYEILRKYPEWINMGGQDDNVYFAFYNEMYQSDIEKVLKMREAMFDQNYALAKEKLLQIANDNTINTNRKIAGNIYLDTWGSFKYELSDEQQAALTTLAYLTPYAGGDAVYTARVMLDINPDEIHLDYVKPPVHYHTQAKELNAVVFPNPAKDKITVKFIETIAANGMIEFYGMMGNLVYTTTITKGVSETQINISSLKSGLYFYTVKVNDTKITSGKITIVNK
ncbi:MAG: T9SS type A sorting domain-containing protein [Bacteroidales bacterium]